MIIFKRIQEVSSEMKDMEALVKAMLVLILVPLPILAATLGGFWLDYYQLDTLPLFTAVGAFLGMAGVITMTYKIVLFGHKRRS